ncbi:MAG: hypothetical protein M0R28_20480 [Pigmentiphaga sp.]|nr:hypothetical protein [Pigmentiphaga sp.]
MIFWALVNANGCIEMAGSGRVPPAGYIPFPPGVDIEFAEFLLWDGGAWGERPAFPEPEITPGRFHIPDCPEGVIATVSDGETGAFFARVTPENGALEIEMPEPGEYAIDLQVPEPWARPGPYRLTVEEV